MKKVIYASLIAFAGASAYSQDKDTIYLNSGQTVSTVITGEDSRVVKSKDNQYIVADIDRIDYFDAPSGVNSIPQKFREGKYSDVLSVIKGAEEEVEQYVKDKKTNKIPRDFWWKWAAKAYKGYSLARTGGGNEAEPLLNDLDSNKAQHRFGEYVILGLIECAKQKGDAAAAKQMVEKSKEYSFSVQLKARLEIAEMFFEGKSYPDALAQFKELTYSGSPQIAQKGMIGVIRCLEATNNLKELEGYCNEIIQKKEMAYNLKFYASAQLGKIEFDRKQYLKSIYLLSKVTTFVFEGDVPYDAYCKALYFLGRAYEEFGTSLAGDENKVRARFFYVLAYTTYRQLVEGPENEFKKDSKNRSDNLEKYTRAAAEAEK